MTSVPRVRRFLLGSAATVSAASCLAALLTSCIIAAIFAAVTALLVVATLAVECRPDSSRRDALVRKAAEQAEAGRKLAIYERTTGLFAHWYMALRGEEECNRAARYERPLALLVVEPAPESNVWAVQEQLAAWLRGHLRAVDVPGSLGNGRYMVLLPETNMLKAEKAVGRLHGRIDCLQTGLSTFPEDGVTFEQLYAAARDRLGEPAERAA